MEEMKLIIGPRDFGGMDGDPFIEILRLKNGYSSGIITH